MQFPDILVHISMDQFEILLVAASIMVLFWLRIFLSSSSTTRPLPAAGAMEVYLLLNMVFLAREGLTNLEQGDGPRIALFVFVFLTAALSALLVSRQKSLPSP